MLGLGVLTKKCLEGTKIDNEINRQKKNTYVSSEQMRKFHENRLPQE